MRGKVQSRAAGRGRKEGEADSRRRRKGKLTRSCGLTRNRSGFSSRLPFRFQLGSGGMLLSEHERVAMAYRDDRMRKGGGGRSHVLQAARLTVVNAPASADRCRFPSSIPNHGKRCASDLDSTGPDSARPAPVLLLGTKQQSHKRSEWEEVGQRKRRFGSGCSSWTKLDLIEHAALRCVVLPRAWLVAAVALMSHARSGLANTKGGIASFIKSRPGQTRPDASRAR